MDLISVIVPIYNLDAYLYQCVNSIVGQTYKHLEIILVDDGSTDNALEICEFFRKSDARVQFINKPNGGLVSARKAGLNASTGQYVVYVDGDDWIDPECIQSYHDLAVAHGVDLVIADYKREFLGNLVVMRNLIKPGLYDRSAIERDILPRMIYSGEFFNHAVRTYSWGKLYKRSLIEKLQNAVPNQVMVAEDAALLYPAIYQANAVYVSDLACCYYRQRPNSILKSTHFDQRENKRIADAFAYMASVLKDPDQKFGFKEQLRAYFSAITIIRNGAFLDRSDLYHQYPFFGKLRKGCRLALYNSGSFGQHVYKHLEKNSDFEFVAWFDEDFRENQLLGMPVSDPAGLGSAVFDYLLVPSFDEKVFAHVQRLCQEAGVPKQRILPVSFDSSKFSDFIVALGFDPDTFLPATSIMILGGNPETGAIVEVANGMGLRTVVVDPYPHSPSKRKASVSYDIDVTDLEAVDQVIAKEDVKGVLVGVADPLVPYYPQICARWNFHCYATVQSVQVLASKSRFAQVCAEYGIASTPQYSVDVNNTASVQRLPFPVVVKPVDGAAGVGMSVCRDEAEFKEGYEKAQAVSIKKEVMVERYMNCDDILAYYTIVNGRAYLSAAADRIKTSAQAGVSAVCIAAHYPSRHLNRYIAQVDPKVVKMLEGIGVQNGVLLIQFFVDESNFYAYDPGFRLQGEAPHFYLDHFNGFDQRKMLLKFALTGTMYEGNFAEVNDCHFSGQMAMTLWVLLKAGKIGTIQGMEAIESHPNVILVLQRFHEHERVSADMLGTERQVLARIYTVANTQDELREVVSFVNRQLKVSSEEGEDMILDLYQAESLEP